MSHEEILEQLADDISMGFGWIAEDMLDVYAADENIPWWEAEEWFDKHYPVFKIEGIEGWNISSTAEQIREDILREM